MTKKVVLLVLALAMAATTTHADAQDQLVSCPAECGKGNGNMECPNNLCCSKDGFCGLGSAYCSADAGCQSGACSGSRRCGWQNNGATCPGNQCCSWDGYCGLGDWFCRGDCQSGPCHNDIKCGQSLPGGNGGLKKVCPDNLCCNKDGLCGLGEGYCSDSAGCQSGACYNDDIVIRDQRCGKITVDGGNGKTCVNKRCCSVYGYCGTDTRYCGSGCQKEYGTCQDSLLGALLGLDALLGCTRPN